MKLFTFLSLAALSVSCFLDAKPPKPAAQAPKVEVGVKLSSFSGNYVAYGHSVGWAPNVALPSATFAATRSQANVSQLSIDKEGQGTFNFISYTIHSTGSPFGTTISTSATPSLTGLPFTINLTNPEQGAGTVTFANFPSPGSVITFDFVSLPNDAGKVQKFFLNATNIIGTTVFPSNNASFILAERQ